MVGSDEGSVLGGRRWVEVLTLWNRADGFGFGLFAFGCDGLEHIITDLINSQVGISHSADV